MTAACCPACPLPPGRRRFHEEVGKGHEAKELLELEMDNANKSSRLVIVLYEGQGAVLSVHGSVIPQRVEVIDVNDLREAGVSDAEVKNTIEQARKGLEKIY